MRVARSHHLTILQRYTPQPIDTLHTQFVQNPGMRALTVEVPKDVSASPLSSLVHTPSGPLKSLIPEAVDI